MYVPSLEVKISENMMLSSFGEVLRWRIFIFISGAKLSLPDKSVGDFCSL